MRLILVVLSLFAFNSWADCNDLPGGQVHYCVFATAGSTNPDVIYYLHGRFGKAEQWGDTNFYTEQIRQEWVNTGKQAPKVISVSFGPVWLLAEKNTSMYSGLFEVMRDQVIPALEQITGGTKGQRIIMGESMGGFNSVQLSMKTDLFSKAAILCAPVAYGVDPFTPIEDIDAWIKKSTAYAYYGEKNRSIIDDHVGEMITMGKTIWVERANWVKSDPLTLASGVDKAKAPSAFYVAAGFFDPYVLYEGNTEMVSRLRAQGLNVEWRPQWGGHCAIDIPSLASFLVP